MENKGSYKIENKNVPVEEKCRPSVSPGLTLVLGPMFSGKTSFIFNSLSGPYRFHDTLAVNHQIDNRYGKEGIITHSGRRMEGIRISNLDELRNLDEYKNAQVVAIDEGSFFSNLDIFVKEELKRTNKKFIITSLNGDSDQNPFGKAHLLIPHADDIIHLKSTCSICKDGTKAPFTKCLIQKNSQVLVGSDQYIPVCRKHLHN